MKKDRQSFFNESTFQQSSYNTMPNYGMPMNYPMNSGYGQQSSQSFYAGAEEIPVWKNKEHIRRESYDVKRVL